MSKSRRFEAGRRLATKEAGEEIVIAGISGRFPKSDNVKEYKENLMNKVDMCDDDERRWKHTDPEIPKLSGKINQPEKFDTGFFGVHRMQADEMDPIIRISLESAFEAFVDAGMSPEDVKGSRTGVFVGSCNSESEVINCYNNLKPKGYSLVGCTKSMIAQRISYALQLNGPSMVCDTACGSSLQAMIQAYKSICEGKCDMAIVGGTNLCFNLNIALQHARLGVLNMNTGCRPFDDNASGFTRSEAIVMILLQKKKFAKRIYTEVVHCKSNVDGYKEQGILQPSGDGFSLLFKEIYEEANVSPSTVAYIEAHGTGTVVGDPLEVNRINEFFCPGRENALFLGSCKSNTGHTEPASGLCSMIKLICAMESGIIPPNINFDKPNKNIKALLDGSIKVVTEKTPWPNDMNFAAVNNFGFGGTNCHVLLKRPDENNRKRPFDNQATLVCYSGRTTESMQTYRNFLISKNSDYDSAALIHSIFKKRIENDDYRGFSLIDSSGELHNSYKYVPEGPRNFIYF
ncbi:PREDICTED: fatty acid synthase-like [Nicrophorus vespilloides]|uniref:Fatty acid synthase-like n=1 Tax=Nicrophorus vespilloides TaxID=110193 RepID=A0ABM1M5R8_NICVS|nr:PREDICTED: fatty acid synthase-like [Nicrophorus vespilloides]